ncbi:PsiF family protein [Obesumbacterium proteus]|uniref:PsiF family protein n=1 Tax=Obesumbacterium proteus TaxID=82983 RepID=UPI00242AE480|nr:PsiF family protein [Obesumbacterium proteus]
MFMRKVLPLMAGLLLASSALAADPATTDAKAVKAPSAKQLAQQKKMTDCSQQASSQSLSGDARKTFMSTCLKAETNPTATTLTPQQQKMKTCNAEAKSKTFKEGERKTFMSGCLKKK